MKIDYILFNVYEAILWATLAFVVAFILAHGVPHRYRFLSFYTTITLAVFAMSDVLENYFDYFTPAMQWLFILKTFCVLSLAMSIIWFMRLRMRDC